MRFLELPTAQEVHRKEEYQFWKRQSFQVDIARPVTTESDSRPVMYYTLALTWQP